MKNKFKKLAGLLLAAVMALAVLPIQTLASEWGKGDTVYAAMLGDYVGSDGKSYGDKRNYTFIAIIDTCTDIASSVFTQADEMIIFPSFDTLKSTDTGLWIIGELLNQFLYFIMLAPIIIVVFIILIVCVLIMIKLMLRTFELALYCSVSTAFFACLLVDATKGYFKRFIDGFLSSALSLVYMGIIYIAGSYWCKVLTMNNVGVDSPMDVLVWLSSAIPKVLVVLAMGFLILKPPLALRQLTGGS